MLKDGTDPTLPAHTHITDGPHLELPQLAALFVVKFDVRKGYTLDWHRSISGVKLEDAVEYKCLPSGLHTVKQDLVYFVHEGYAGVSAFASSPAPERVRNASLLAVGVLVPLGLGRLGKCWRHAETLKRFARTVSQNGEDTDEEQRKLKDLAMYWSEHRFPDSDDQSNSHAPLRSPLGGKSKGNSPGGAASSHTNHRNRSVSVTTVLGPSALPLSAYHPALSMWDLIDTFGPLLFPLYRAALLRKRILFVGQAPIEQACNFVYDLSVLSSIPSLVNNVLADENPARLRSLFAIGVHDISFLEEIAQIDSTKQLRHTSGYHSSSGSLQGWVACTTDTVLATKRSLYDMVVYLPRDAEQRDQKVWPKIETCTGAEIRATQRDSRRYNTLMKGLLSSKGNSRRDGTGLLGQGTDGQYDDLAAPAIPDSARDYSTVDEMPVEPMSWSALGYSSFMWWASAGEQQADFDSETAADETLMEGLESIDSRNLTAAGSNEQEALDGRSTDPHSALPALPLIVYFRRLTSTMLSTVSEIIDSANDEEEEETAIYEEQQGRELKLNVSDISRLGLDVWSSGDVLFVKEFVAQYFDREAEVESIKVECCGLRIH
ncbi:MAG: hypothetical protein M1816_005961 [Peltula sp. TS41687]|nr:MAG: hypothetical protein M1816_005961 [Peltula sp. TS41687]